MKLLLSWGVLRRNRHLAHSLNIKIVKKISNLMLWFQNSKICTKMKWNFGNIMYSFAQLRFWCLKKKLLIGGLSILEISVPLRLILNCSDCWFWFNIIWKSRTCNCAGVKLIIAIYFNSLHMNSFQQKLLSSLCVCVSCKPSLWNISFHQCAHMFHFFFCQITVNSLTFVASTLYFSFDD